MENKITMRYVHGKLLNWQHFWNRINQFFNEYQESHLRREKFLENSLKQEVVINEQGKYVYDEGTTWNLAQIIVFFYVVH